MNNVAITVGGLFGAAGTVCTVANSVVVSFYGSIRLNHLEIWSPSISGAFTTCSCEWTSSNLLSTNTNEISDTSVSITTPAHISTKPPSKSLASFWQSSSNATAQLCTLNATTGSIIEVSISMILYDDESTATQYGTVVSTGTLGKVYYLSLDNPTANNLIPVSLTTTH
jgi:hypothetical protein